jgi:hypothetical protein
VRACADPGVAGIEQFANVRVLSLAHNCITDLGELSRLQSGCTSLQVLNVQYNPICALPYFRWHVIYRLPGTAAFRVHGTCFRCGVWDMAGFTSLRRAHCPLCGAAVLWGSVDRRAVPG